MLHSTSMLPSAQYVQNSEEQHLSCQCIRMCYGDHQLRRVSRSLQSQLPESTVRRLNRAAARDCTANRQNGLHDSSGDHLQLIVLLNNFICGSYIRSCNSVAQEARRICRAPSWCCRCLGGAYRTRRTYVCCHTRIHA
jgi:hypothetical protein